MKIKTRWSRLHRNRFYWLMLVRIRAVGEALTLDSNSRGLGCKGDIVLATAGVVVTGVLCRTTDSLGLVPRGDTPISYFGSLEVGAAETSRSFARSTRGDFLGDEGLDSNSRGLGGKGDIVLVVTAGLGVVTGVLNTLGGCRAIKLAVTADLVVTGVLHRTTDSLGLPRGDKPISSHLAETSSFFRSTRKGDFLGGESGVGTLVILMVLVASPGLDDPRIARFNSFIRICSRIAYSFRFACNAWMVLFLC